MKRRKLLSILLRYLYVKNEVTIDRITGIIDSKKARFDSRIGKSKKETAKTINQMRNPYNIAFLIDFIFVPCHRRLSPDSLGQCFFILKNDASFRFRDINLLYK